MRRIIHTAVFAVFSTVAVAGNCSETTPAMQYPDVPLGRWEYDALRAAVPLRFWPPLPRGSQTRLPFSRVQFAVAVLRAVKNHEPISDADVALPGTTALERLDALAALQREFTHEICCLARRGGCRDDDNCALDAKVAKPPRLLVTPGILRRSLDARPTQLQSPH